MSEDNVTNLKKLTAEMADLSKRIALIDKTVRGSLVEKKRFSERAGELVIALADAKNQLSPVKVGSIDVTLGNPKSIAKFFTFNFINKPRLPLAEVTGERFYGSGVYAIYYEGKAEKAYVPLSGTETPIYVGKADPAEAYAETTEAQGEALYKRLSEHARNIAKTNLNLSDFTCRNVAIQSGMQSAVEHFMIQFYQPIWNKEIKVCFGIGKHGDSAKTRANKRSPWDTMHPGRKWAAKTKEDQKSRKKVEEDILEHLIKHPPIPNLESLMEQLSLG